MGVPITNPTRRRACGVMLIGLCLFSSLSTGCQPITTGATTDPASPIHESTGLSPAYSPSEAATLTPPEATSTPTATPRPTLTATVTLSPTPLPWRTIARGIEQTYLTAPTPGSEELSYIYALRIDPNAVTFRVHYDHAQPHSIEEWQTITDAPIIFNGGFFGGNNVPVGRIITDGQLIGVPLDYGDDSIGVPGLFAIADGKPELYALGRTSYNPRGLRFEQAVESYPMLLLPGGQPTFPTETGYRARRTVIALDEQGRVLVLLSDIPLFSLYELSEWLAASNLRLDSALNLDGGRSSGLGVNLADEAKTISSFVPLPIVIGIYLK